LQQRAASIHRELARHGEVTACFGHDGTFRTGTEPECKTGRACRSELLVMSLVRNERLRCRTAHVGPAQLLARVTHHAPPARLLPPRQLVAPARERILAASELDADRRTPQPQRLAKRILEIAPVLLGRALGLRAVYHDQRRM